MKCWHCNNEVIWGGDHDYDDYGMEGEGIVSNLNCSKCEAEYLIYLPIPSEDVTEKYKTLSAGCLRTAFGNKIFSFWGCIAILGPDWGDWVG